MWVRYPCLKIIQFTSIFVMDKLNHFPLSLNNRPSKHYSLLQHRMSNFLLLENFCIRYVYLYYGAHTKHTAGNLLPRMGYPDARINLMMSVYFSC